jgi:hypothetical protein
MGLSSYLQLGHGFSPLSSNPIGKEISPKMNLSVLRLKFGVLSIVVLFAMLGATQAAGFGDCTEAAGPVIGTRLRLAG